MNKFIVAAALVILGTAGQADSVLPKAHVLALACLENLGTTSTWNQCLGQLFAPCLGDDVGTESHVRCLQGQRENWSVSMTLLQKEVTDAITLKAATEMSEILGGWVNYVSQKCEAVSVNASVSADSARLGCQITEFAGLTGEYAACLEGRSTAEYCVLKD
tara:strand:- start:191 stop:673 length:483 start_codon:yes stop_codon:yes gene_type:complete